METIFPCLRWNGACKVELLNVREVLEIFGWKALEKCSVVLSEAETYASQIPTSGEWSQFIHSHIALGRLALASARVEYSPVEMQALQLDLTMVVHFVPPWCRWERGWALAWKFVSNKHPDTRMLIRALSAGCNGGASFSHKISNVTWQKQLR